MVIQNISRKLTLFTKTPVLPNFFYLVVKIKVHSEYVTQKENLEINSENYKKVLTAIPFRYIYMYFLYVIT